MGVIVHQPECTWSRHINAGEIPPGQSFWGRLNYVWCHAFCGRPIVEIDFDMIYEAARGKGSSLHRKRYDALVKRAIDENSEELRKQALSMVG